ncbi:MAG: hypothetical protein P4L57_03975 [Rhizomicrobium sp.]|nr:hypothetical protein [Rhizomicrobium sp.]
MAYYFLKKYRLESGEELLGTLIAEWVLSAESDPAAVQRAGEQLQKVGLDQPDSEFAVLFDYRGEIVWDRGP